MILSRFRNLRFPNVKDPFSGTLVGLAIAAVLISVISWLANIEPKQIPPYAVKDIIPISSTMEAKVTGTPTRNNASSPWVVPVTVTATLPGIELISVQQKRNSSGDRQINAWTVTVKTRTGGSTFDVDDFENKFPSVDIYQKFQVKIDWVLTGE